MIQNLEQIRYMTRHYSNLQGLRFAIFGFAFLLIAACDVGWLPIETEMMWVMVYPLIYPVYMAIESYYKRSFGQVSPIEKSCFRQQRSLLIGGLALMGAMCIDVFIKPPINMFGLTGALLAVYYFLPKYRFGREYGMIAIVALLIAGISLMPLGYSFIRLNYIGFAIALIFFVGCIFDHLLLVRTMKLMHRPLQEQEGEQS